MAGEPILVFDGVEEFAAYVRLSCPPHRQEDLSLTVVAHPTGQQSPVFLLAGHTPPDTHRALLEQQRLFVPGTIRHGERGIEWCTHPTVWQHTPVLHRMTAQTLLSLVDVVVHPDPPQPKLLICMSQQPEALGRFVVDSMALGNDRLAIAQVSSWTVLRIESPSWFVIEQSLDRTDLDLFTPIDGSANALWVPWGWRHPLAAMWRQIQRPNPHDWLLFRSQQPPLRLREPRWRDLYEVSDVTLAFETTAQTLSPTTLPTRFSIPVHLAPRAQPPEAVLWMVPQGERAVLETLLSSLDEQDLDDLLIAPVQSDNGTAYFLRERQLGKGRNLLDANMEGFATWQGIDQLFVPTQCGIEPRLRRDQYRTLFDLQPGHLTVLRTTAQQTQLLHVPTAAFVPFRRLVDFILSAYSQKIKSLQAEILFDFAPYNQAPSRPIAPAVRERRPRPNPQPQPQQRPKPKPTTPVAPPTKRFHPPGAHTRLSKEQLSALEQQEQTLERSIIQSPSLTAWEMLMSVKSDLDKPEDAIQCALETWWLTASTDDDQIHDHLREQLTAFLKLHGDINAQQRAIAAVQEPLLRTLTTALFCRKVPAQNLSDWLSLAAKRIENNESQMPKKVLWLAWGEVWRHNNDTRGQERIREDLLQRLNQEGITSIDVPRFIQRRLLLERQVQRNDLNPDSHSQAMYNLSLVEESSVALTGKVHEAMTMSMDRHWHQMEQHHRAPRRTQRRADTDDDVLLKAWGHLQLRERYASTSATQRAYLQDLELQKLLQLFDRYVVERFQGIAETMVGRRLNTSADSFLSQDNTAQLFPIIHGNQGGQLHVFFTMMRNAQHRNDRNGFELAAHHLLTEAISHTERIDPNDQHTLIVMGRFLAMASREIIAHQRHVGDERLTQYYCNTVNTIQATLHNIGGFFSVVVQATIARTLIALQNPQQGMQSLHQAQSALRNLQRESLNTIDVTDSCTTLLQAIQNLPLDQRGPHLRILIETLSAVVPHLPDQASTINRLLLLQTLDQICETAVSKDLLALTRFRQYQDLDELIFRERLLHENFCRN